MGDLTSVDFVQKQSAKLTASQQASEYWNCRRNPFYFIFNYIYIPEIGGILKYDEPLMHDKMKQTIKSIHNYHKTILMASRQLGKSTIAASYLEWAANFYPNMPITLLNMTKKSALENIEKIKFMHHALPDFLRTPLKYKGDRKTTLDYQNESIIRVFYPSSTTSPNTLARSFTSPGLYIDEAAHIRHMKIAYTAAQPTLSRAREQAIKHGYPYFILITSTPNGSVGDGEWFYDMYNNAVDADDIFDENNKLIPEADQIVENPKCNGFVKVRFHWSEDPAKDDVWYNEQCRDFNFDSRSINQELDLVFVGSTNCIFSDDFLSNLRVSKPVDRIQLPHATDMKLFTKKENLDKTDYLLIGVDTAKSITGDYSAIEIFKYSNFEQIGEFYGRLGSLTKYSQIIMKVIDILEVVMNNRLILCIENNSIGASIIEDLENADDPKYSQYIYSPFPDKYTGINTNSKVKPTMISFFYDLVTQNPQLLKSEALINQLNLIERKSNGTISSKSGGHDDLFMASCLCAYVKKISVLEYEPLLGLSAHLQNQQNINKIKGAIRLHSETNLKNTSGIKISYNKEEGGIEYNISNNDDEDEDGESYISIF